MVWEAQWTPFFQTQYLNCSEGSVHVHIGSQIEVPRFEVYQIWEFPTGRWSPPDRRVVIPWNDSWLDITKLNLVHNRG